MGRLIPVCCLLLAVQLAASVFAGPPQTLLFLSDEAPVFLRLTIEVDGGDYEATWNQYVDELFRDLDYEGGGTLRGDEIARIPTAQQMSQLGFRTVRSIKPPVVDVTREQLDQYLRGVVGSVFEVSQQAAPTLRNPRAAPPSESAPRHRADENLFKGLDANQDGSLSAEEFAITTSLRKLDVDDDETIGRTELEPATIPFYAGSTASMPLDASIPLLHVTPLQSLIEIAHKILDRYDRAQPAGADYQLDASEIHIPPATFSILDADGNGSLDFDEVVQMVRWRTTHLEITIRIGKGQGVEVTEPDSGLPFHGLLRNEKNSRIVLVIGKTQIEIGPEGDGPQRAVNLETSYKQILTNSDADKNGYLDETESQRTPFRAAFKLIDRDGNGMIFEEELVAYAKQIAIATRSRISLEIADQGNRLFNILDADGDQRLTSRELADARKRIDDWDDDDNQQVSAAEFPRHWQLTLSQGTRNSRPTFFQSAASMRPRATGASAGPIWFQKMDNNRDGDVSKREFLGPLDDFHRIDQNGDGLLSLAEAAEFASAK